MLLCSSEEHPRSGFPTVATGIREMRTVFYRSDGSTPAIAIIHQFLMNRLHHLLGDPAPIDGGLIGDHDDGVTEPPETSHRCRCEIVVTELLAAENRFLEEVIEDSIPIEKEARYAAQDPGRPVARSARKLLTATRNPWMIIWAITM